ncbi:ABC transporter ATP-binding protein [Nocardioides sp. GXZ039]|uniref:ABC transporter ATP-binding protein n=1 Tax=Nocardioides sp. GXZ039 TaxID=3136018 RepID=UPI0030F44AA3
MNGAKLEIQDVVVRFLGARVLDGVSLDVAPGSVHGVIGPNGAGKSSLFNVVCGVYRPASGRVLLDGRRLVGLSPHRIAALGVGRAFQNASMVTSLSVEENLLLGQHRHQRSGVLADGLRLPRSRRSERQAREAVRTAAALLGIEELLDRRAEELPYGAAKRVDVARALASEPRLLLLDEPAAGMHAGEKDQMSRSIRRVADELGTTVLLVEHDMPLVMGVCDEVTVLNFGTVVTTGSPSRVRADPEVVCAYLGGTAREVPR